MLKSSHLVNLSPWVFINKLNLKILDVANIKIHNTGTFFRIFLLNMRLKIDARMLKTGLLKWPLINPDWCLSPYQNQPRIFLYLYSCLNNNSIFSIHLHLWLIPLAKFRFISNCDFKNIYFIIIIKNETVSNWERIKTDRCISAFLTGSSYIP